MKTILTTKEELVTKDLVLHTKTGTKFFKNVTQVMALAMAEKEKNLTQAIWGKEKLLNGQLK